MDEPEGTEVPIVWQGRRVRAFVPTPLAARRIELDEKSLVAAARAGSEVAHAAEALDPDYEPLARLLLRAEGVASSFIEGVRAPLADVVIAEQLALTSDPAAGWVAANLAALGDALASAGGEAFSVELVCRWHTICMTGSPLPGRYVGALRTEQGWIGGTDPTNAALVTPPPDAVLALVEDLVAYVNRDDLDPVVQAAVAHAQFEIIHPFGDGNGRVGRVLVSWILARRMSLVVPPPVSVAIAADIGGYLSGLTRFRLGDAAGWVRWFSEMVAKGGRAQRGLLDAVGSVKATLRARLERHGQRSDAAAWRVLDLLPRLLVLTTRIVERELGISNKAANAAMHQLVDAGVLSSYERVPGRRGRPARLYVCPDLLALAGSTPVRRTA